MKFTELEAEVCIIRISYIGFQYFVSLVFVMRTIGVDYRGIGLRS